MMKSQMGPRGTIEERETKGKKEACGEGNFKSLGFSVHESMLVHYHIHD
jgi:hypothetical protein